MSLVRPWYGLGLLMAAAAACAPKEAAPPPPPTVDSAAVKAAVAGLWQRWVAADTAGDAAAKANMVTDSVRVDMKGAPPILGREAWKAVAEAVFKQFRYPSVSIMPDVTVAISNDLAYENGSYVEDVLVGTKKSKEYGRYAGAIRKDADGQWRVSYIMSFADSTVAAK